VAIRSDVAIEAAEVPPPHIRYRRALDVRASLRELWESRQVVVSLTERDLRSRYSQMVLGFLWTILGPLALTAVITLVLNKSRVEIPGGVPRPVWIYTALMPWSFFAGAVSSGGVSLISNNALLNKVYVPREVFPISQILTQIVSSTMGVSAFVAILVVYGYMPKAEIYWVPLLLLIGLVFAAAVTVICAGLTVFFRDLRQAIPVLLQLGLFANPIAYDFARLSDGWQHVVVAINPLAAVIDGMRRSMLYGEAPRASLTLIAAGVAVVEFVLAYLAFKQMEAGFADVA
jgi:ABC-2 type transport system permease protein/lipopolysaccharide transport system permease protein